MYGVFPWRGLVSGGLRFRNIRQLKHVRSQICMGRAPMAWWGVTALPNVGTFVIIGRWRREAVGALSRSDQFP